MSDCTLLKLLFIFCWIVLNLHSTRFIMLYVVLIAHFISLFGRQIIATYPPSYTYACNKFISPSSMQVHRLRTMNQRGQQQIRMDDEEGGTKEEGETRVRIIRTLNL